MGDQQKKTAMKFKMMQFCDVKHIQMNQRTELTEAFFRSFVCLWLWVSCVSTCAVYVKMSSNACVCIRMSGEPLCNRLNTGFSLFTR